MGFSPEELLAVMRGLELVSFDAGDVIVAEGAAGDSMFILTSGKVKAYVKTPKGKSLKVQEFEEGDFFGEISVLTGKPRTATLTAAENCDCLELTRAALDEITKTHPGVREVLKKFQKERALSTVQAIMADKG
jgi:cAMP-dependent protein kinase regulator